MAVTYSSDVRRSDCELSTSGSWGPAHLREGATVISGNARSAAMAGVTGGGLESSKITTPRSDACNVLVSDSLSAASTLVVST